MPSFCFTVYPKCCQFRICCWETGMNKVSEDCCQSHILWCRSEGDSRFQECQVCCWQCGDQHNKTCASDMPRCMAIRCCCFRIGAAECAWCGNEDDICRAKCGPCHSEFDTNAPACQVCCVACLNEDYVWEKDIGDLGDLEKSKGRAGGPAKQDMYEN